MVVGVPGPEPFAQKHCHWDARCSGNLNCALACLMSPQHVHKQIKPKNQYVIIFFGVCLLINTKCLLYYNVSVLIRAKRYGRSKTEKGTTWFQSWAVHSIQQDCCGKEQLGQLSIIAADIQTPALTYFPSIFV